MAYPDTIEYFRTVTTDEDTVEAQDHNDPSRCLEKVEETLGTNPEGSFADVKTRLDDVDDTIGETSKTDATLENSWVNYGSPYANVGYWKDGKGYLHMEGLCSNGTQSAGTVVFTLPSGYRPSNRNFIIISGYSQAVNIRIDTNGEVKLGVDISTSHISFSGVCLKL